MNDCFNSTLIRTKILVRSILTNRIFLSRYICWYRTNFVFSVHLKLGLSVSDFVDKVKNVKVMEVSTPRTK